MIKAIIIDDTRIARENLAADIRNFCPGIELVGEAESVVTGVKSIRQHKPDLVFLDIQLTDGTGFDLLEIIGEIDFRIIFTTASDAHAIKAFKYSAIDYLLKPIDSEELKRAVQKVSEIPKQKSSIHLLMESAKQNKPLKKLALNTQEKIHIVNISDIIRCESDVNYTLFYFNGGQKLLVTRTLKEFEEMLEEHSFIRVHQSHLVNSNFIKEFVKGDGGYLVMSDGSNVPVSTRKRNQVVELLNAL